MSVDQFLVRVWQDNSLRQWLTAGALLAGTFLVLALLRHLIVARLGAIAKRTTRDTDGLALDLASRTRDFFLLFVALAAASRVLVLPPPADRWLGVSFLLLFLLQGAFWGNGLINYWARQYLDRRQAHAGAASVTTIGALSVAAKGLLWTILLITALDNLGISITAELTTLGVGGIALALAVQNVLSDLLAALAIVLDKPFDVGDPIAVDQLSGTVEHIGLKTTRIRSDAGEQVVVANSELLKSRIRNYKRMYQRRVAFTTDVTYDTSPEVVQRVPSIIKEIVSAQNPVRFQRCHFSAYTDSALRFETVYYVLDPDYVRYMDVQQAVYLELLRQFNAQGIHFAFPTRTIELPKRGTLAALPAESAIPGKP